MSTSTEKLLEELVERWTRGEPLAVAELLARAGPQADELAGLIDAFLRRAPRREATPEALAFVRSLDESSLLRARQEKRLKLDDLTDLLVKGLGLKASARAKVRRYYQDLELGRLDPSRVAGKVWDVLTGLLGPDARKLAGMRAPAPAAAPMYREADVVWTSSLSLERHADMRKAASEPDEVDRLFGVTASD